MWYMKVAESCSGDREDKLEFEKEEGHTETMFSTVLGRHQWAFQSQHIVPVPPRWQELALLLFYVAQVLF